METIRFTASSLPLMALFGPHAMSDLSPLCAAKADIDLSLCASPLCILERCSADSRLR
jgi:hypothetical protein